MKYSKQREEILSIVKDSKQHPTAEMIYLEARKRIPNISLGTVYRNLKFLVDQNMVKQIKGLDEKDRYDKTVYDHGHMLCGICQTVYDIKHDSIIKVKEDIYNDMGFTINDYNISVGGVCHKCQTIRKKD